MNIFWENGERALSGVSSQALEHSLSERGRTQGDAPTRPQMSDIDSEAACELDAEGHCITCSDEALTARVLRIDQQMGIASVAIGEASDEVDITLLEEVAEGDLLLVHGGVAIANVGKDADLDEASDA